MSTKSCIADPREIGGQIGLALVLLGIDFMAVPLQLIGEVIENSI